MDPDTIILICIFLAIGGFLGLFYCAFRLFSRSSGSTGDYSAISGGGLYSGSSVPREFLNDEEALNHLAEEYDFSLLSPEEQIAYLKGEEYTQTNPPNFHNYKGSSYTNVDLLSITDKGLGAFEFEQDLDFLQPRYIVEDRTEVNFNNNENPYSCVTSVLNYSLPVKNRAMNDIVYFEVKIFEIDTSRTQESNQHFAIGLVTKPYPSHFRLPGYNSFSVSYESTGNLKINKPLPSPLQQHQGDNSSYNALILPALQQSDVVGFGYIISTGTLFVTHNGKKIMDIMKGCFVDLYPAIGCFLTNAKFQVNLGQLGFVWIEANVRKYGFIASNDQKKLKGNRGLTSLPEYSNLKDKVLDKGEELPPRYPEEELDFFGRSTLNPGSSAQLENQKLTHGTSEKSDEISREEDVKVSIEETKPVNPNSSTSITNEPEEVMDLRERIYEQSLKPNEENEDNEENEENNGDSNVEVENTNETQPLLSNSDIPVYVNHTKDETPGTETEGASPVDEIDHVSPEFDSSEGSSKKPSRETTPRPSKPKKLTKKKKKTKKKGKRK